MAELPTYQQTTALSAPTNGVYIQNANSAFLDNISSWLTGMADKATAEVAQSQGVKDQQERGSADNNVAADGLLGQLSRLTTYGKAYSDGATQIYATQKQMRLSDKVTELQKQFPADTDGFRNAYDSAKKEWLKDVRPDLLPNFAKYADEVGSRNVAMLQAQGVERQKQTQAVVALDDFSKLDAQIYDGTLSGKLPQDQLDEKLAQANALLKGAVDAGYLTPMQAREQIEKLSFNVKTAEILKQFRNNPTQGFVEAIKNAKETTQFGGGTPFTPQQRQMLGAKLDAELNQMMSRARVGEAKAQAAARKGFNDHIAQLGDGLEGTMTDDQIKFAFNGNPTAQAEALQMSNTARANGLFMKQIGLASPQEVDSMLQARAPVPNTPGYADQKRSFDALQTVVAQRNKAISDDSAGYVLAMSPDLRAAYESPDVNVRGEAIATMKQLQSNIGVPAGSISVMPKSQAVTIASNFNSLAVTEPTKAVEMVDGLRSQYGDSFQNVVNQLARLPTPVNGSFQVLSTIAPGARAEMVDAMTLMKEGKLTDMLDKRVPGIKGTIDQNVQVQLTEFDRTVDAQNDSRLKADIRNATEALAYLRSSRGMKPEDAAKSAANDVIGQYGFVGTVRVPKGMEATTETAIRNTLANLKPSDLEPMPNYRNDPAYTVEWAQKQQYESLKRSGRFINDGDGGIVMTYPNGARVRLNGAASVSPYWGPTTEPTSTTLPPGIGSPVPETKTKPLPNKLQGTVNTPGNESRVDIAREQVADRRGAGPRFLTIQFNEMAPKSNARGFWDLGKQAFGITP